jgi:hypothetical protein
VRVTRAQLLSGYCVTIKNELPVTFASLGSEVAEWSILSRINWASAYEFSRVALSQWIL